MTETAFKPVGKPQKHDRDALLAASLLLLSDVKAAAARWDRLAPKRFGGLMEAGNRTSSRRFYFDHNRLQYGIVGAGLIAPTAVRAAVDQYAIASVRELTSLTDQAAAGTIRIDDWQELFSKALREHQAVMVGVGGGGVAHTTERELYVGSARLRFQLERADIFAEQFGRQDRMAGSLQMVQYRSRAYALASVGTYEEVRRTAAVGVMTEERRFLRPADHCRTCVEQAGRGWSPLGSLKPIGDSLCLWNCHCYFLFRRNGVESETPPT